MKSSRILFHLSGLAYLAARPAMLAVVGCCLCPLATSWMVAQESVALPSPVQKVRVPAEGKANAPVPDLGAAGEQIRVDASAISSTSDRQAGTAPSLGGTVMAANQPLISDEELLRRAANGDLGAADGEQFSQTSAPGAASQEEEPAPPAAGGFHLNVPSRDEHDERAPGNGRGPREPLPDSPGVLDDEPVLVKTPPQGPGYFPTGREWESIGGYLPRIKGDSAGGDESGRNTRAASGLFPYPSSGRGGYSPRPAYYDAVDRYLGLFAPGGGLSVETQSQGRGGAATLSSGLPFLTRSFNPERATMKLGPVYLDLLALSGTLLYSDYHGPAKFASGEGDGFAAVTALDFRVVAPLTESLFLAVTAEVYYLPFKNRVGFFLGQGAGLGLGLNFFSAYETRVKGWEISVTDYLGTGSRVADYTAEASVGEIQQSGRYRFGRDDTETSRVDPFAQGNLYLANTLTASAIGLLTPKWRMAISLSRRDSWDLTDLNLSNYRGLTLARVFVDYAGQDWRFAPFASYDVSVDDSFERFLHSAYVGVQGPITEQLRVLARAGYGWTTGGEDPIGALLYEVGLTHEVGPYTSQSLFAGSVVSVSQFNQRQVGKYIRYTLSQILSRRFRGTLFAQWSDTTDVDTGSSLTGILAGVTLSYSLDEYTRLFLSGIYETGDNFDRQLVTARLERRVLAGLYLSLLYQHEHFNSDASQSFYENLYSLTMTQLF